MNDKPVTPRPRRELSFPHLIKWAEMAVRGRVERALRTVPVTSGQLLVLVLIDEQGEATAAELARLMYLTPQTMTTLLRPLRDQGLIDQRTDERHRRRLQLLLTDVGRGALEQARVQTPKIEAEILADFTDDERATLTRLLTRLARPPDR